MFAGVKDMGETQEDNPFGNISGIHYFHRWIARQQVTFLLRVAVDNIACYDSSYQITVSYMCSIRALKCPRKLHCP